MLCLEKQMRLIFVCILAIACANSGCSFSKDYLFQPTVIERAKKPIQMEKDCTDNCEYKDEKYAITDRVVVDFMDQVKNSLRKRMNYSRIIREISASAQVLTAAAAAVLGATQGNLTTVAIIAATSAVIPDMQDIFDAKAKAQAYDDGLHLIEEAEGRYILTLTGSGEISNKALTVQAANLYVEVLACLKLVEKALTAKIPSIKELQVASGVYLDKIKVSQNSISLDPDRNVQVEVTAVTGGPFVKNSSTNPKVAMAVTDGSDKATISTPKVGGQAGTATITLVNAKGDMAKIFVESESPIEAELVDASSGTSIGSLSVPKAGGTTRAKIKFITKSVLADHRSDNNDIVTVKGSLGDANANNFFFIEGKKKGSANIILENAFGTVKRFPVEVK